ncbi:hypothetical protein P4E94_07970 [Pontiellaceae bacterium B12219]|nr:hypothetical protein [Pontiellaceae bacterium B12219]
MNEKILKESERDNSLSNAMARGALIWAPLYSIGASTISYYLIADDSVGVVPFKELMLRNLLIISPAMIMAEAIGIGIREKLSAKRPSRRRRRMRFRFPKMPGISSRRNSNGLRPKHA